MMFVRNCHKKVSMDDSEHITKYPSYVFEGKVLLLNAPIGCGKDYASDRISLALGCKQLEFKAPMFKIAMVMTGLSEGSFFEIYDDRERKEVPQEEFYGLSPRDFMIWISEDVCKPKFGKEYFGEVAARCSNPHTGTIFSDSGFPEEVSPLVQKYGAENVYVCQFDRGGSKFESNDSRGFLSREDLPSGVVFLPFMHNDGCIQDFVNKVTSYVINN